MNTKNTPAPWITDTENDFIFSKGQSETHPNIICRLFDRNEENYPNSEANAKLIAAAPELLEALQIVRNYFGENDKTLAEHKMFAIVDKAIKKATL